MRTNSKHSVFLLLLGSWSYCCSASTLEVSFAREILHPPQKTELASALPINVEKIALALRWTGEMNRRLYLASQHQPGLQRIREEDANIMPRSLDALRGGQASVYRIASSRPKTSTLDTLTVFHTKHPDNENATGARRWGPDLSKYLHTLVALLSFGDSKSEVSATELTLAMIFMDRACSVETPRSDGHIPCPYCTPRTVHRLTVAALLVAVESVRGAQFSERLQIQVSNTLHIPKQELEEMVNWLRGALGDQGTFVGSEQFDDFATNWKSRFGATPSSVTESLAYEPLVS